MNWDLFDKQLEMFPKFIPVAGFTKRQMMVRYNLTNAQADGQIVQLLKLKRIVYLGVRPDGHHSKVYDNAKANRRTRS